MQKYPYRDSELAANSLAFDANLPRLSRGLPPRRANRLRVAWFVLGMVLGIGVTLAVTTLSDHIPAEGETIAAEEMPETLQFADDELAETLNTAAQMDKPAAPRPAQLELTVGRGDTLSDLLARAGVKDQESHQVITAIRKQYNPRRLTVGQKVHVELTPESVAKADDGYDIAALRIKISPTRTLQLQQNAKDALDIRIDSQKLTRDMTSKSGKIRNSLYQTGIDAGLTPTLISSLINAYSYDIDFQRDIKQGDRFQVVYETMRNEEGEVASTGKLLFASLNLSGQEKRMYYFTDSQGNSGFYDPKGQNVRKALLKTPINGARLSSGFGMRKHPVLGYSKMHKGVDFAAATGTPVYAAGDGVVEFAGRKGGYGNYVRVDHNKQYATAYAHMSKIKARKGARVKQGDVIGFVGTTGRSTGPHLHYELLAFGNQINPKSIKFDTGVKLAGRDLANFKASTQELDQMASRLNSDEPKLAQAN